MTAAEMVGRALITRRIDDEHEAILAHGRFDALFKAYLEHVALWERVPDALALTMMRQALGGASLHLSCRPRDEIFGLTVNIREPAMNLFVTGDAGRSIVTGRVLVDNVRTAGASRMFVESRRDNGRRSQSIIEISGYDTLRMFERYYAQSEQCAARFFELADAEFLMIVSLPTGESPWLESLDAATAQTRFASGSKSLDERIFWFQCGCGPERILDALTLLYRDRPEELFRGEGRVEVFCPRCGRKWWQKRDEFDRRSASGENSE